MTLAAPPKPSTLDRVLAARDQPLTPEHARYILTITFTKAENRRCDVLSEKVRELPGLTPAERVEIENLLLADDILTMLKSKSRVLLGVPLRAAAGQVRR